MNALTRFQTQRLRPSLANDLFPANDLFAHFFRPVAESTPEIRLEVSEDANAYSVAATIPGVRKEDIHVSVEGGCVTIEAEVRQETKEDNARVLHSERFYGKTSRSFTVAQDIEESAVEAKYADGLLKLVLPKKATTSGRKITIA
jgi:HSP20 family protein